MRRVTVLQREGELILIPPRCWHQTYHLEPSVALAGQYLNSQNSRAVVSHICDWCGIDAEAPVRKQDPCEMVLDRKGAVSSLLREALVSKYGDDGKRRYLEMVSLSDCA